MGEPGPRRKRGTLGGGQTTVEIGLFTEFEWRPGVDEAQAFDDSLTQTTVAEELGYDAVWLAELHFQKERSVLASPLVVGATIAGRTKRVKIGFAVQVLPLPRRRRGPQAVPEATHAASRRGDVRGVVCGGRTPRAADLPGGEDVEHRRARALRRGLSRRVARSRPPGPRRGRRDPAGLRRRDGPPRAGGDRGQRDALLSLGRQGPARRATTGGRRAV